MCLLCFSYLAFSMSFFYGILRFISQLTILILYAIFTRYRYRKIHELSFYLQQLYQGKELFDIRDYNEGELSMLKSDIYKITQILKWQSETLLQDKTYLADSLSNISHQLKTPLTSMIVMSDLLNDEQLPNEKRMEFVYAMKTQLKRIEWMVSSLLKISKIDAEAIHFQPQHVALLELVNESLKSLLIPMDIKDIHIHIDIADDIMVELDPNWSKEAFLNIIKNCMEHTPEHGNLWFVAEENPLHTILTIRDDGCGIDAEDLPHIFDRFYKGKNSHSDSVGIGLSMTKTILMKQRATVEVSSEQHKGTTFMITLFT